MDILERIAGWAERTPASLAFSSPEGEMTYGELWEYAGRLCAYIETIQGEGPLPVWGHKSPWMLVCFLALARAGRGYCPLDTSLPRERAEVILSALQGGPLFAVASFPGSSPLPVMGLEEIQRICRGEAGERKETVEEKEKEEKKELIGEGDKQETEKKKEEESKERKKQKEEPEEKEKQDEDIFYVIFTSGSTGTPKGVMVKRGNLSRFVDWSLTLSGEEPGRVFLNQAPFSFDLSVMDLYTCLASGGTLFALTKEEQGDYKKLLAALEKSRASVWVSTPSFAELCLADPGFSKSLLPELSVMLFCGETLTNKTAGRLLSAFPGVKIYNTYGPTESTVAVTSVLVEEKLVKEVEPLPVGRAKPGTWIEIWDEQGRPLPEGEKGEVVLWGDTVTAGYLGREDLTRGAFLERDEERGYRTGDEGYLKDGFLFYCGRLDLQIKLHGYRMELGDIESALLTLPEVNQAVVLPRYRQGRVSSLLGVLVLSKEYATQIEGGEKPEKEVLEGIRLALKEKLPEYMVPKKLVQVQDIPMTANGKADRKALSGRL